MAWVLRLYFVAARPREACAEARGRDALGGRCLAGGACRRESGGDQLTGKTTRHLGHHIQHDHTHTRGPPRTAHTLDMLAGSAILLGGENAAGDSLGDCHCDVSREISREIYHGESLGDPHCEMYLLATRDAREL